VKTALEGAVKTTELEPNPGNLWDALLFFVDNHTGIKWFLTFYMKFVKYNDRNETMYAEPTFRSQNMTLTNTANIEEEITSVLRKLHNDYQNFERDGSGWSIDKIVKMDVNTAEYVPLNGSSYVPLPCKIKAKKAVFNIVNDDQKCFVWSVLAYRVSNYIPYESTLSLHDIQMPMSLSDVPNSRDKILYLLMSSVSKKKMCTHYTLQIVDTRNTSIYF